MSILPWICAASVVMVALFAFPLAPVRAEDPMPSRIAYRRLTWEDFRVNDAAPGLAAQTRTYLSFRYKARTRRDNSVYRAEATEINFEGGFDRDNSWRRSAVRPDNARLLAHEQGHLDMNEIRLRRLKSLPLSAFPTPALALSSLTEKLKTFYDAEIRALADEQKRYDAETKNGTLRDAQRQWAERLKRELSAQS